MTEVITKKDGGMYAVIDTPELRVKTEDCKDRSSLDRVCREIITEINRETGMNYCPVKL
jgi:hypothetical protein